MKFYELLPLIQGELIKIEFKGCPSFEIIIKEDTIKIIKDFEIDCITDLNYGRLLIKSK